MPGCFIPVPITLNAQAQTPGAGGLLDIAATAARLGVTAEKGPRLHS